MPIGEQKCTIHTQTKRECSSNLMNIKNDLTLREECAEFTNARRYDSHIFARIKSLVNSNSGKYVLRNSWM